MKKIILVICSLLLVGSLVACASGTSVSSKDKITLGTSADYPPFEFIVLDESNAQKYVGIDISVAEAIAADMNKELSVMNMDFDTLIAALQKGDIDIVIAAMEETPERLEGADFSDAYYTDYPAMILVKADKAGEYTSLDSFAGKSVGAQTGTTKADIVTNDLSGATLVGLTSVNELVNQLVYDKVDAIVLDGAVALQYAQSNEGIVVASVELGEALPYRVAVQKGDPKGLLGPINETIAKLISDGSIDAFAEAADALADQAIE